MPQHATSLSPTTQPRGIVSNNNRGVYPSAASSTTSGVEAASSSSLVTSSLTASPSPKPKKSILKQFNKSPMASNSNPLPPIPKSTRPATTTKTKQQKQQQLQPVSDELSYLPVDGAAVVGAGIADVARNASVPYQPTPVYPQSATYQQQQQFQQLQSTPFQPYQPQPIAPFQQPMPAFYSYDSNNSSNNNNDYSTMNRFSGGTPPTSSLNTTQLGSSGYEKSHSTDSTHRSSRNMSPAPEPNYNLIQTDATLEGLAQRWFAYQAVMKKSYAEDPFYKRWTWSKWLLLFSALLLLGYSGAILGISLTYIINSKSLHC
ncbi:MAG: hypothetical protein J3R72DRAFT_187827 [Linnemannia gamsii]|nr:MAG: hypothetical protein J3R72DRAFT_187827 [Linnemannia gamsii]